MKFDLADVSVTELQERFVVSPEAPHCEPYSRGGEHLHYFFELDGIRMGEVELFHNTDKHHLSWNRVYPFCPHLTPDELRGLGWVSKDFIRQQGEENLRRSLCDYQNVADGLEKTGLGTLAHTMVARHFYKRIMPAQYTTSYFSEGSIKPRLIALLKRAGVGDMIDTPCLLKHVQLELSKSAEQIFGFQFDEI